MTKIYVFKHYPSRPSPPPPPPHSFGLMTLALNSSHTYNPLFEKILDPPLQCLFFQCITVSDYF